MINDGQQIGALGRGRASAIHLQQLRYAVLAAEHGSLRRAATALRLRQSTLSRCIRGLEEAVGLVVFERSSGGVRTTPAGDSFLRTARSILEQVDALVTTAYSTGRGEAGRLVVGFYCPLSGGNLRATLVQFVQRFPQMELGLIERSQARLVTALRNEVLDIAIVIRGGAPLDCSTMLLWSERIVIVLPEGHRLAANGTVYWTDLKGETLLVGQRDPSPALHGLLMTKLVSESDRPKIVHYDVSRGNLRSLVSAGLGISLATEASVVAYPGVVYREIHDGAGSTWIGYSAHWRATNNNPALASFLELLGERYSLPADTA